MVCSACKRSGMRRNAEHAGDHQRGHHCHRLPPGRFWREEAGSAGEISSVLAAFGWLGRWERPFNGGSGGGKAVPRVGRRAIASGRNRWPRVRAPNGLRSRRSGFCAGRSKINPKRNAGRESQQNRRDSVVGMNQRRRSPRSGSAKSMSGRACRAGTVARRTAPPPANKFLDEGVKNIGQRLVGEKSRRDLPGMS